MKKFVFTIQTKKQGDSFTTAVALLVTTIVSIVLCKLRNRFLVQCTPLRPLAAVYPSLA